MALVLEEVEEGWIDRIVEEKLNLHTYVHGYMDGYIHHRDKAHTHQHQYTYIKHTSSIHTSSTKAYASFIHPFIYPFIHTYILFEYTYIRTSIHCTQRVLLVVVDGWMDG